MTSIGFYVLAPQEQIDLGVFEEHLEKGSIEPKVRRRVGEYSGEKDTWLKDAFLPVLDYIDIDPITTRLLADYDVFTKFEIHPGDELFCLGFPLAQGSNDAGFPILRSGKIASFPVIPAKIVKTFLFDFEVFSGNSGGPVYFAQSGRTYRGALRSGTITTDFPVTVSFRITAGIRY